MRTRAPGTSSFRTGLSRPMLRMGLLKAAPSGSKLWRSSSLCRSHLLQASEESAHVQDFAQDVHALQVDPKTASLQVHCCNLYFMNKYTYNSLC